MSVLAIIYKASASKEGLESYSSRVFLESSSSILYSARVRHVIKLQFGCRKTRLYAMQDVEELLAKEGLRPGEPFAGVDQLAEGQLPLAIFDDTKYESRNPGGWISKLPGAPPAPGRVAMPSGDGSFAFQECNVVDYNQQQNSFLVQLASDKGASGKAKLSSNICHGLTCFEGSLTHVKAPSSAASHTLLLQSTGWQEACS